MPQPVTPAARLVRLSDRFDRLIRDYEAGPRSHREHERLVGEAEAIANDLRAVFRGQVSPQSTAAPLFVSADGLKAAW